MSCIGAVNGMLLFLLIRSIQGYNMRWLQGNQHLYKSLSLEHLVHIRIYVGAIVKLLEASFATFGDLYTAKAKFGLCGRLLRKIIYRDNIKSFTYYT